MNSLLLHLLLYLFLILSAVLTDILFHKWGYPSAGLYAGPIGLLCILISLYWSWRKRYRKTHLKFWLSVHEISAWIGTALILVHAGKHFHAILPWVATLLLCIVSFSGHIGRHLLTQIAKTIHSQNDKWELILHDSVLKKWRSIHFPLAWSLAFLSMVHIASIAWFGNPLYNNDSFSSHTKISESIHLYRSASGLSDNRKTISPDSDSASTLAGQSYKLADKNLWLYSIKPIAKYIPEDTK